jgi:nucleoid-associated protein YgaU
VVSAGQIALAAALTGALGGTAWVVLPQVLAPVDPPPLVQSPSVQAALPAPMPQPAVPAPAEALAEAPRFDVARVGARGMLVAAGRSAPQAEVVLFEAGRELGRARADGRGEWVILPTEPLGAGARELALEARRPGGSTVPGREVVVLVVPEATPAPRRPEPETDSAPRPPGPLAVVLPAPSMPRIEPPRLLQMPPEAPGAAPRGMRLGLDLVDYEEDGEIRFAGTAPPGVTVRIYVDAEHVGDADSNAAGRWQLTPVGQPAIGRHMLRVDQLAPRGAVSARVELPFQREALPTVAQEGQADLVVQPGQNLWRIARRVYGRGTRYTVIYEANRAQIRDPRRIYPGQLFTLPGGSVPAASSLSR